MNERVRILIPGVRTAPDEHLRACLDPAGNAVAEAADDGHDLAGADVLYFSNPVAADEVLTPLAEYPGCVVCTGMTRDGTVLLAVRAGVVGGIGQCPADVASIVHALLSRSIEVSGG